MSPVSSTHGWIDTQMLQVNITMGDFPVVNWLQRSLQITKIPKIPPKPFIICVRNTETPLWQKGNADWWCFKGRTQVKAQADDETTDQRKGPQEIYVKSQRQGPVGPRPENFLKGTKTVE